jgi:hypothetical protein
MFQSEVALWQGDTGSAKCGRKAVTGPRPANPEGCTFVR